MNEVAAAYPLAYASAGSRRIDGLPRRLYCVEALGSLGTNLLVTSIYFYTTRQFHWGRRENFLLATTQGLFYVAGALSAGAIVRRIDQRKALAMIYAVMSLAAFVAWKAMHAPLAAAALLLVYICVSSMGWPILESLLSQDLDSHALSRRVSVYNLIWAAVAAVALAIDGTLLKYWPTGIFLIPALAHATSCIVIFFDGASPAESAPSVPSPVTAPSISHGRSPPVAEPELLRVRTLALWLSRVALPATYVAIYGLMALMPSLPVVRSRDPAIQTLLCSTWMVTRWLTFLVLGLGTWWHTRPRLLLVAAVVMLVAFFGITLRPSDFFASGSAPIDLGVMILAQLALGVSLGLIYSASLYFGMVLSEGSTEHGGYHEALIGLGFFLGPGAGALAEIVRPGSLYTGIGAVGAVLLLSVAAVSITSWVITGRAAADKSRGPHPC